MRHERVNGVSINTEKKWCHLKESQKSWICQKFRDEYSKFVLNNNKYPTREDCKIILDEVYDIVSNEKNIWIPFEEVRKVFFSKINKYKKSIKLDSKKESF